MSKALRAFIRRILPRETREIRRSEIWKAGPERRLVKSCTLKPDWDDNSGNFVVRDVELSRPSFWSADTSPHATYIYMYKPRTFTCTSITASVCAGAHVIFLILSDCQHHHL